MPRWLCATCLSLRGAPCRARPPPACSWFQARLLPRALVCHDPLARVLLPFFAKRPLTSTASPPLPPGARRVPHPAASQRCTEGRSRVGRGPLVRLAATGRGQSLAASKTATHTWRRPRRPHTRGLCRTSYGAGTPCRCSSHGSGEQLPGGWRARHQTDAFAPLLTPPTAPPAAPAGGSERAAADEQRNVRGCLLHWLQPRRCLCAPLCRCSPDAGVALPVAAAPCPWSSSARRPRS